MVKQKKERERTYKILCRNLSLVSCCHFTYDQVSFIAFTLIVVQCYFILNLTYFCFKVEGDGRLVPATDAEVMQVENMLQDCENELPEVEGLRQT